MLTPPSVEGSGGTRRRWCSTCPSFSWLSSQCSRPAMTAPVGPFTDEFEQQVVPFVLALIIGGVCYLVERASQRSRAMSLLLGVIALVLGLAVATLKSVLSAH